MRGSKIPVQELWLKMGGGRIRKGGIIAGFYGISGSYIVVTRKRAHYGKFAHPPV